MFLNVFNKLKEFSTILRGSPYDLHMVGTRENAKNGIRMGIFSLTKLILGDQNKTILIIIKNLKSYF